MNDVIKEIKKELEQVMEFMRIDREKNKYNLWNVGYVNGLNFALRMLEKAGVQE
jgi:hypothetical protein